MLRNLAAAVLLIAALKAQTAPVPIREDRAADTYAVYSVVVQNPKLSHPANHKKILIQGVTGFPGETPAKCTAAPPAYRTAFAEITADFEQHKNATFRLERKFTLSLPYEILDTRDAKQFMDMTINSSTLTGNRDDVDKFHGATDLLELGTVYFNRARTLAVVRFGAFCGGLCGLWTTRVLEKKRTGSWQELNWTTCIEVATNAAPPSSPSESLR